MAGKTTRQSKIAKAFPERQLANFDASGRTPVERVIREGLRSVSKQLEVLGR